MLTVVIERKDGTRSEPRDIPWHAPEAPLAGDLIDQNHATWHVRWRRWSAGGDLTIGVEEFSRV